MLKININTHLIENARQIVSNNYDNRPKNIDIDTIIIHCISLPAGEYDNDNVIDLFQNNLDVNKDESFEKLHKLKVSAHLFIRRNGDLIQFVPLIYRAWHAGVSNFRNRQNFNDFSIGVELEGTSESKFTDKQYDKLKEVINLTKACYPKIVDANIIGHNEVSPERKKDPGIYFDWERIKEKS